MFENGYRFTLSGAIVAAVSFFLPVVLVSCGNLVSQEVSGWQLATGNQDMNIDGDPAFFFILIAAIIIISLAFSYKNMGLLDKSRDGIMVLITSVIPILILFSKMDEYKKQAMGYGVTVEYKIGYYGIILGFLLAVLGGFQNLGFADETQTSKDQNDKNQSSNTNDTNKINLRELENKDIPPEGPW